MTAGKFYYVLQLPRAGVLNTVIRGEPPALDLERDENFI